MADLDECDDTCEPDVGDGSGEPYLYSLQCPGCGLQRATSHCPHDGVQTPCPDCRWLPPGTVSPLQFLGVKPVVVEPAQGLPGSLPEWGTA